MALGRTRRQRRVKAHVLHSAADRSLPSLLALQTQSGVWLCYVLLHVLRREQRMEHSIHIFSQWGKLIHFSHRKVSARGFAQLKDALQLTSVFLFEKNKHIFCIDIFFLHCLDHLTLFKRGHKVQLANKINRMVMKCCC